MAAARQLPRLMADNPPSDIGSEEAVIAAILMDSKRCFEEERIQDILEPGDFYRAHNGWVYAASRVVGGDSVTLAFHLDANTDWSPEGGWLDYLLTIEQKFYTAIGVEAHARQVARLAFSRRLIGAVHDIAQFILDNETTATVLLEQAHAVLGSLKQPAMRATGIGGGPGLGLSVESLFSE